MRYDYNRLTADIDRLTGRYSFIGHTLIGESVMRRGIHCITIGSGGRKTLIAAAFHGLESITAAAAMKFAEDYAAHITGGKRFFTRSAARLFIRNTLYILPMINPDGIGIAANGINLSDPVHKALISSAGIHDFKNEWQANARGVDLNHNYDAGWRPIMIGPSPSKYGGEYPGSEPETRAVVSFVRRSAPDTLIALHSQGEEIYCDFNGHYPDGAADMADNMARLNGYTVCRPSGTAAFGGCKDWFIREFDRPGFTIEVGRGKNPLPLDMLDGIYPAAAKIILCAMK